MRQVRTKQLNSLTQSNDPEVAAFRAHDYIISQLDEIICQGTQKVLKAVVEQEKLEGILKSHANCRDEQGRRMVEGNGYNPSQKVKMVIRPLDIWPPRARDNSPDKSQRVRAYLRRAPSIEQQNPWIYSKGISTGEFGDVSY